MNRALVGKTFEIPKEIIKKIKDSIARYGLRNVEGSKRAQRLVKEKILTYGQIKRLIHDLKNIDKSKQADSYELNGGIEMEDWANKTLDDARGQVSSRKNSQARANEIGGLDGIRKNAYNDTHDKKANNQLGDILKGGADGGGGIMSSIVSEEINRIKELIKNS